MIGEAVRGGADDAVDRDPSAVRELLPAVAPSVDTLAVGLSFALLPVPIGQPVVLDGVCTAVLGLVGVRLGRRVGSRFGAAAEIAGGVILVLIGTGVLLGHTGVP